MSKLKILHICSYFSGSSVYLDLVNNLAENKDISFQYIYSANKFNDQPEIDLKGNKIFITKVKCLNFITRLFLSLKIIILIFTFKKYSAQERISSTKFTNIHAHTLYADGILALYCSLKYQIPYTITVRGTDANLGERFYFHWYFLTKYILNNAKHIIFLSPQHKDKYIKKYQLKTSNISLIPNGANEYWIKNSLLSKSDKNQSNIIKGIYLGKTSKNKNLKNTLDAYFSLKSTQKLLFTIIGESEELYVKNYGKLPNHYSKQVVFIPHLSNKAEIKEYLKVSDFMVMASYSETFGLSYLEAISQATPVIYSQGQGISGYFEDGKVGFMCNPHAKTSIALAISKTITNFPLGLDFRKEGCNPVESFCWENIAKKIVERAY